MAPRVALTQFRADDVADPVRLHRALNDFARGVYEESMALRAGGLVSVLDDVRFRTGGTVGVGLAPFPIRLRAPDGVRGAWVVMVTLGDGSAVNASPVAWVRPLNDASGTDGNLELTYLAGVTTGTEYVLRLAVLHG